MVLATTPSGSDLLTSCIRSATRSDTTRLFSPSSMMAVPMTTSSPFSVAAPVRSSRPSTTSATSPMRIGVPSW